MSNRKGKIGLREIASAAQVSVATVSRVLNGSSSVDPATRKIVLDTAAKLDFDLSQRNKTKAVAFLLCNRMPLHVFQSRVLIGAETFCDAHGWDIVFLSFNYSPNIPSKELPLPRVIQRGDVVRGVILAGKNSSNLIELLDHKGLPSVVLGNNILGKQTDFKNTDVVSSNDIQGGEDTVRYLLSLGHRHICFVGNLRLPWFARCSEGYSRAMKAAGLEPRQSSINSEDDTEIGYLGTKSLLARGEPVTAIFAGNDQSARGVYMALRDSGLKIPEDVSVTGCSDTIGGLLYPALTTIREFPEQLGKKMVELVLNRIAEPGQKPQLVTMPIELVKRDSCRRIDGPQEIAPEKTQHSPTID